MGFYSKK